MKPKPKKPLIVNSPVSKKFAKKLTLTTFTCKMGKMSEKINNKTKPIIIGKAEKQQIEGRNKKIQNINSTENNNLYYQTNFELNNKPKLKLKRGSAVFGLTNETEEEKNDLLTLLQRKTFSNEKFNKYFSDTNSKINSPRFGKNVLFDLPKKTSLEPGC